MSIYICGFMGSGKTTLWKNVIEATGQKGFDFDEEIARRNSIDRESLGEFIEKKGWDEFRKQEIDLLKETLMGNAGIYALGGGTVTHKDFTQLIKKHDEAKVLWLNTPVDTCWERVRLDKNRPLIRNGKEAFYKLYTERQQLYSKFEEIDESYVVK